MTKNKSAAVLTIHRASEMTPKGKKNIAAWLRRQAKDLLKYGNNYSKVLRARYLYASE